MEIVFHLKNTSSAVISTEMALCLQIESFSLNNTKIKILECNEIVLYLKYEVIPASYKNYNLFITPTPPEVFSEVPQLSHFMGNVFHRMCKIFFTEISLDLFLCSMQFSQGLSQEFFEDTLKSFFGDLFIQKLFSVIL